MFPETEEGKDNIFFFSSYFHENDKEKKNHFCWGYT